MTTPTDFRAQRLVDEFEEAANSCVGCPISHGIAAVLTHLADTEGDEECWHAVPISTLRHMAEALTAPTLAERAMAGDTAAARQFLLEAGFTDERGQLLPQYQPEESQP